MDFHKLLVTLKENKPDYRCIEFIQNDLPLTLDQLKQIKEWSERNTIVGNVKWPYVIDSSHKDALIMLSLQHEIETRLEQNNFSYKQYPSHFVHLTLCFYTHLAHESQQKLKENQSVRIDKNKCSSLLRKHVSLINDSHLAHWYIVKVFQKTPTSSTTSSSFTRRLSRMASFTMGQKEENTKKSVEYMDNYFGILFANDRTGQMVLCHSGICLKFGDVLSPHEELQLLANLKLVSQQVSSLAATRESISMANLMRYGLSTCGYGLGAHLANLSTYFATYHFNYPNIKAFGFNSPGILTNSTFDMSQLKIDTYLSVPNVLNSEPGNICHHFTGHTSTSVNCFKLNFETTSIEGKQSQRSQETRVSPIQQIVEHLERQPVNGKYLNGEKAHLLEQQIKVVFGYGVDDLMINYLQNELYINSAITDTNSTDLNGRCGEDNLKRVVEWPKIVEDPFGDEEVVIKFKMRQSLDSNQEGVASWITNQSILKDQPYLIDKLVKSFPFVKLIQFMSGLMSDQIDLSSSYQLNYRFGNKISISQATLFDMSGSCVIDRLESPYEMIIDLDEDKIASYLDMLNNRIEFNDSFVESYLSSSLICRQLNELKTMYKIERSEMGMFSRHRLVSNGVRTSSEVYDSMQRLCQVEPKLVDLFAEIEFKSKLASPSDGQVATLIDHIQPELFYQREETLYHIEKNLFQCNKLIMHGPAGSGKSCSILAYINQYSSSENYLIRWLNAENEQRLLYDYQKLVSKYETDTEGDDDEDESLVERFNRIINRIADANSKKVILVYDNMDEQLFGEIGVKYLKGVSSRIRIIITTRLGLDQIYKHDCFSSPHRNQYRTLESRPLVLREAESYLNSSLLYELSEKNTELIYQSVSSIVDPTPLNFNKICVRIKSHSPSELTIAKIIEMVLVEMSQIDANTFNMDFYENILVRLNEIKAFSSLPSSFGLKLLICLSQLDPGFIDTDLLIDTLVYSKSWCKESDLESFLNILRNNMLVDLNRYEECDKLGFRVRLDRLVQSELVEYLKKRNHISDDPDDQIIIEIRKGIISAVNKHFPSIEWRHAAELIHELNDAKRVVCQALKLYNIGLEKLDLLGCGEYAEVLGRFYENLGDYFHLLQLDHRSALDLYLKSAHLFEQAYQSNKHESVARVYLKLGSVYHIMSEYQKSLDYELRSLEVCIKLFKSRSNKWVSDVLYQIGLTYTCLAAYDKALEYLNQSLEMSDKIDSNVKEESMRSVRIRNQIGHTFMAMGYFEQSLTSFEDSLLKSQTAGLRVADAYCYIGKVNFELGDYYKALENFKLAYEMKKQESCWQELSKSMAYLLTQMAKSQFKLAHYSKALDSLRQALDIYKRVYSQRDNQRVAGVLHEIALAHEFLAQYDLALEYYELSYEIRKRLKSESKEEVESLQSIGRIYYKLAEFVKSSDYFTRAFEMCMRLFNGDNSDMARSLHDIGIAYEYLRKYDKALDYLKQSWQAYKQMYRDEHPHIASILSKIGSVYDHIGDYQKALGFYELSLQMRRQIYRHLSHSSSQPNSSTSLPSSLSSLSHQTENDNMAAHPEIAACLFSIGKAYSSLGEAPKSLDYLVKSLEMRKKIFYQNENGDHPDLATNLSQIASVYEKIGDYGKAMSNHKLALEMRKQIYTSGSHPEIAASLNSIGSICTRTGEFEKAMGFYQLALEVRKTVYGVKSAGASGHNSSLPLHPQIAKSLSNMGSACDGLRDHVKALEYKQKALEMRKKLYAGDENHVEIASSYQNLSATYDSLGEFGKAAEYKMKAIEIKKKIINDSNAS